MQVEEEGGQRYAGICQALPPSPFPPLLPLSYPATALTLRCHAKHPKWRGGL